MWYQRFDIEDNILVYSLSMLGPQKVQLNGRTLFTKNQNQYPNAFDIRIPGEHNKEIAIKLVSKYKDNTGEILLDVYRDNEIIHLNVALKSGKFSNKFKKEGISKLEKFELDEAMVLFQKGLELVPRDAEIYFSMACIHSVQENTKKSMECLQLAFNYGFNDMNELKTNDKLAFLRIQDEYENFVNQL